MGGKALDLGGANDSKGTEYGKKSKGRAQGF